MDERYLEIRVKNLKFDLDSIVEFNRDGNKERMEEYINSSIKVLKQLKDKL